MSARSSIAVAVLFLVFSSMTVLAQDRCQPFGGTIYGWHTGKAWVGEGDFYVGVQKMHANIEDVNTGLEKHGDLWWGTETATFDFGNGNTVQLVTEFTTEHMQSSTGVFHVNENGGFANGTGRFRKAQGRFTSQGPFGPSVVLPAAKVANAPSGMAMYWIGHYDGTICGVASSAK